MLLHRPLGMEFETLRSSRSLCRTAAICVDRLFGVLAGGASCVTSIR